MGASSTAHRERAQKAASSHASRHHEAGPGRKLTPLDLSVASGEPRIKDLVIAERLGFAKPVFIRRLIRENMARLGRRGIIDAASINHGGGRGRPGVEYWLNRGQALQICMLSQTPRAIDVQEELIDVFEAKADGLLVISTVEKTPPPTFQPALAEEVAALLARTQQLVTLMEAQGRMLRSADAPAELGHAMLMARPTKHKRLADLERDIDVHDMVVRLHRRQTIDEAQAMISARFGPMRAPSRSALGRYWVRMDRMLGGRK